MAREPYKSAACQEPHANWHNQPPATTLSWALSKERPLPVYARGHLLLFCKEAPNLLVIKVVEIFQACEVDLHMYIFAAW
eukprot:6568517-Prymnesium_polylepis.1